MQIHIYTFSTNVHIDVETTIFFSIRQLIKEMHWQNLSTQACLIGSWKQSTDHLAWMDNLVEDP